MSSMNLNSNHGLGELGMKAVKLEQDIRRSLQENESPKFDSICREESNSLIRRAETEKNRRSTVLSAPNSVPGLECAPIDDSSFCSTSSISPAPICRQFWRAGNYDDRLISKPACQNRTGYLHIHPKFLHSNATSHKWAFGAVAEFLDNSIDEIQNGATFVSVDKTSNPRDGTTALLIQDDGGGMNPEAMRRCISFGFSDKHSKTAIGQYGNGFKTSSMRLGADVVVLSRSMKDRKLTKSVGLLSYTFLTQTGQDRIVVPMVDYEFDSHTETWNSLHDEQHLNNNLPILLEWSPFTTEAELLQQCDDIGPHGTKIIVYNLWHNDDGKMELDFETDPEDIRLCSETRDTTKFSSKMKANEQHLANRLKYSLRAYLSVLYLRYPENFCIILRGKIVKYHNIGNDLQFPEFIKYRPQNVEGSVITTIGFLKEAPDVNIHGFNVYHKNRLILPFWHVVTYSDSRGRGVVGLLEANFIKPIHNKQDFEKTPVFQKLEARLKEMTQEYWDYHCGLLGYQVKKPPRPMAHQVAPNPVSGREAGIYQPVMLTKDSSGAVGVRLEASGISLPSYHHCTEGATLKRKRQGQVVDPKRPKMTGGADVLQHATNPDRQLQDEESVMIIQENQMLRSQCKEYEEIDKALNLKIAKLREEISDARREYARMQIESKVLEKVKRERENRELRHV
ncbi:protein MICRORCHIDIA 6 [Salvia miltiorrhiza]|uniref:protein MICRORCHIDIA 6 n=1 Tax=Salvia miltiorrhiza TaxID=226208 RepID=UPI0025AC9AC5|nr:protein MICRORCHIDIA 6 [Salvia miltiorrhiza]